jgi:hypothetical protein
MLWLHIHKGKGIRLETKSRNLNLGIKDTQENTIVDKYWKYGRTTLQIHDLNNLPENLELEPEQEIRADEKGPYI